MPASFRISTVTTLYEQHYEQYLEIAKAILRSTDQATDAVQNVFTYLLGNSDKLAGVNNYNAYIKACIKNAAIDIYRKNKRSIPTDPTTITITDEQAPKLKRTFEMRQLLLKELERYPEHISNAYADYILYDMPVALLAKKLDMKKDTLAHYFSRIKKYLIENASTIVPFILGILLYLCFLFFTS